MKSKEYDSQESQNFPKHPSSPLRDFLFMEVPTPDLVCPQCGMISPYHVEIEKNNNHAAYCDVCGTFIKFLPHSTKPPSFHFGRYKGIPISEITDEQYLNFATDVTNISGKVKDAIVARLLSLQNSKENG